MPIPALVDTALPLGRWPATMAEIEATFVQGQSQKRQDIWDGWLQLNQAIKHTVLEVPAMWLSGSFFTTKPEPGDLDCVYVVEWSRLWAARTDPRQAQFLELVASSQVKAHLGLLVDSFILEWMPSGGAAPTARQEQYLWQRGYWDDLWSRQRSSDPRADAVPRRGYLEVIVDGYV